MAVLGDDEVGIYVAASGFTRDAERDARREQKRKLTLIDLAALYRLCRAPEIDPGGEPPPTAANAGLLLRPLAR
jgi:hypothetical protein